MESKKTTRGQLERRIKNAVVFVPKDKDTKSIFFSDKGLRVTVTSDYAVIETGYHRHVFNNFTSIGVSRPYLYSKRLVEIAEENGCESSFTRLLSVLKDKEDKSEFNIVTYIEWWLFNIFQPLYGIGEGETEAFLVYEDYIHNISRTSMLLSEKNEDVTNRQFIDILTKNMKEFTENMEERVVLAKKTDDELISENIRAIQEQEIEETYNGSEN